MSTTSDLKEKIQQDVKDAMRGKEKARLGVLRMLTAEIKQREVDQRVVLDDASIIAVVDKMVKQRRESCKMFEQGARQDLADKEKYEISVLQEYLPTALTADEIEQLITTAITQTGASSVKDMGKVMTALRPGMQGRADLGAVSAQVKAKLS